MPLTPWHRTWGCLGSVCLAPGELPQHPLLPGLGELPGSHWGLGFGQGGGQAGKHESFCHGKS